MRKLGRMGALKGALMIAAMMVAGVLCGASPAAAQSCGASPQGGNQSYTNRFRWQGSTTRGSCTGGLAVEDWFLSPISFSCDTGDVVSGTGHCRKIVGNTGNAIAVVQTDGCGSVSLKQNGSFELSGDWYGWDDELHSVSAPCTDPECDEGYYWDEFSTSCQPSSPIILSLGRSQRFELTDAAHGVNFDLNNDGIPERIGWTAKGADLAFLAWDRDGDGMITNGSELFGDATVAGVHNGFAALKRLADLETGGDAGNLSADHPLAAKLVLWTDTNHDGISQPSEMVPLTSRVTMIGFDYRVSERRDGFGNKFRYKGWAEIRTAPGPGNNSKNLTELRERARDIYDIFFVKQ